MLVRFAILSLMSFVVVSCGKSGSGGPALQTGYYVAEDIKTAHYPMIIIQSGDDSIALFQVSTGGLSHGQSTDGSPSAAEMTTSITTLSGADQAYGGVVTQEGAGVRVRSCEFDKDLSFESDTVITPGTKVLQDLVLKPVSKEEAITTLRSLITVRGSGSSFSQYAEEACQGAFQMDCKTLYEVK